MALWFIVREINNRLWSIVIINMYGNKFSMQKRPACRKYAWSWPGLYLRFSGCFSIQWLNISTPHRRHIQYDLVVWKLPFEMQVNILSALAASWNDEWTVFNRTSAESFSKCEFCCSGFEANEVGLNLWGRSYDYYYYWWRVGIAKTCSKC